MNIIIGHPPNYEKISKTFILHPGILFTYGTTIYNPDNVPIDDSMVVHEEVHSMQQKDMGIEAWWDKYLQDAKFRTIQELEAYRRQYVFVKKFLKDREVLNRYHRRLATCLSREMYGKIMSFNKALEEIKK